MSNIRCYYHFDTNFKIKINSNVQINDRITETQKIIKKKQNIIKCQKKLFKEMKIINSPNLEKQELKKIPFWKHYNKKEKMVLLIRNQIMDQDHLNDDLSIKDEIFIPDTTDQLLEKKNKKKSHPPWNISSPNSTSPFKLYYPRINDKMLMELEFDHIQEKGYLFLWYVHSKKKLAYKLIEIWGYITIMELTWNKLTKHNKIFCGLGSKKNRSNEKCIIAKKGQVDFRKELKVFYNNKNFSAKVREKSQKPDFLYTLIEESFPKEIHMELFARKCNLRNYFISIGLEITKRIYSQFHF
ncbi:mt-a70 family protein [Anaeramoeba flamelloides]|uniref:mRNA m(6)A methyltransferase n=1 Tax=Anaeramoeba flamelloides TaxID=1746091 RepID=A0ABQ8Y477_9EUKA|nr:mt-a70 family protein [Anaeramoeba flamelloides]